MDSLVQKAFFNHASEHGHTFASKLNLTRWKMVRILPTLIFLFIPILLKLTHGTLWHMSLNGWSHEDLVEYDEETSMLGYEYI